MPENLRIFFLDVGQGDCTFIVPPSGESGPILFDCADAYVAERFVANHSIANLAAVVASHLDIDHVRGLLPFLRTHFDAGRRVERLVMFPDRVPKPERHATLRALVAAALAWERAPPHAGFVLKASHRDGDGPVVLASGEGWSVELVLPWVGTSAEAIVERGNDPNACSAVLRVWRGGTAVLVGGDAPLSSWVRLESNRRAAGVIRVPHHGGEIRDGGADWKQFADLYDAVEAGVAVVSVGTNNGHGHPLPDHVISARRGGHCRLLCTQLTPRCHPTPTDHRNEALRYAGEVEYPYRHRAQLGAPRHRPSAEVPCAGSMVVTLTEQGDVSVLPTEGEDHTRLLGRLPHRLCR